jgi:hypothetical protein
MVVLSLGARLAKDSNREGAFRSRKGTHCLGAIEFASSLSHNRPSSALQATFGNRGEGARKFFIWFKDWPDEGAAWS